VVELAQWVLGPSAGALLADMGAEVIKVENRHTGDGMRGLYQMSHIPVRDAKYNWVWEQTNRSKKSLALDLTQDVGRQVLHRLLGTADAFLTNYRLFRLEGWKLMYDDIHNVYPSLVYLQATGWGSKGPDRNSGAFDYAAFARSGVMAALGEPEAPPPLCLRAFGDNIGSIVIAYGLMVGLFHRERTGIGLLINASLLGGLLQASCFDVQNVLATGQDLPRQSRKKPGNPLINTYQTKDGRWIYFVMLQTDRHWHDFCEVLGIEHLEHDPHFATHNDRDENAQELMQIIEDIFATKTKEEWKNRLAGKNLIYSWVQTYGEVVNDPQAIENGYIREVDHPTAGRIKMAGFPIQVKGIPVRVDRAPNLGEHTEELLLELGYSWEDITNLKDAEVII